LTSELCNPEANHKRIPDYIIRKLILDLENTSESCNLEYYKKVFLEYKKLIGVAQEGMKVHEEAAYSVACIYEILHGIV